MSDVSIVVGIPNIQTNVTVGAPNKVVSVDTGVPGASNILNIGTVDKGDVASATITGTSPAQTLNLVLPKGDKGDNGAGLPYGGLTNQVLTKIDNVNGNTYWATVDKTFVGLANVDNTADINKPVSSATQTALDTKVDKITGKGLSTNDYTTTEQTKLAGIATGANVGVVPNIAIVGATKTKITYDTKGLVTAGVDATTADITASTDKNYVTDTQLTNLHAPHSDDQVIPTALSQLTDDTIHRLVTDAEKSTWNGKQDAGSYEVTTNKRTTFQVTPDDIHYPSEKLVKDSLDGKQPVGSYLVASDITGKEDKSNKVISISGASTDVQYPSAKLVYDQLATKQPTGSYEVTANKENTTIDTSTTKYPTVNLLKTGLDTKVITPATNTADFIPQWNGTNSKTLKDGVAVPAGGLAGITALNLKQTQLTPTTIKTANYTANPFEFIPCDLTTSSFTVTLPSAPADKTIIEVKVITTSLNRVLTLSTGGTDVFNKVGGNTSIYVTILNEVHRFQYQASTGVWFNISSAPSSAFAIGFPGIDATTPISAANISINYTTRVLTITPPLGYFNVFVDGGGVITRYRKTGAVNFPAFTNTSGVWNFYFDNAGVATVSLGAEPDTSTTAIVYRILWNATLSPDSARSAVEALETHENTVPGILHDWQNIYGTVWNSGFVISDNRIVSGVPNADGRNAVIALTTGTNIDDNLKYTVTNSTGGLQFQQDLGNTISASLNATNSALFKARIQDGSGQISYVAATRFPFSSSAGNVIEFITSTGTRTAVTDKFFVSYFVYSIQDPRNGEALKVVSSPAQYNALTGAQAVSWSDLQAVYTTLNDSQVRPLYKLIYESKAAYDVGSKKAALRQVDDIRKAQITQSASAIGSINATSVINVPAGNIASTNVQDAINELDAEKVIANTAITGATKTKITYDTKGLVTAGADAVLDDLGDVIISSPVIDQVVKYNGTNWVNGSSTAVNGGSGVDFFYVNTASDIATYNVLSKSPDAGVEVDDSVVVNNNRVLISSYASASTGLGGTQIDAGVWNFDIWAYVSMLNLASSIDIDIYKRTSGGTETLLFSVNSGTINTTSLATVEDYVVTSVQQAFSINSTDRLVAKIYGKTSNITNTTVHFLHGGTTHYSHFNTPLVTRHNDLVGLQGGTSSEYYHLTSNEYQGAGAGTGNIARLISPQFTTPNIGVATGSISGNSGSATVLQTARNINGVSFNGSADINIVQAIAHGTASTAQLVNVCYGTGTPPAANTTTEGTLYITYVA